ncbi:MAG TPA: class I SAM-dependent methyltransferase, partial [Aggregatilineales bacterium]|nr:class I SAM-dependent methyltransferase [Aggregatilineales bacterium]
MDKKSQQQITIEHFDKTVDFWHRIYEQRETFTGYSLIKQHEFTVQYITEHASIGAAVLDVGCGAGITILELAQRGYQVSGVDLAPMMIEKAQELARKQGLSCDLRVASADRLPYDNEVFDRVIALGLPGNLRDDTACLAEIWRVLRPQGQILVSVPNFLGMDRWIAVPRSLPLILGHEFRVRYRKFLN